MDLNLRKVVIIPSNDCEHKEDQESLRYTYPFRLDAYRDFFDIEAPSDAAEPLTHLAETSSLPAASGFRLI